MAILGYSNSYLLSPGGGFYLTCPPEQFIMSGYYPPISATGMAFDESGHLITSAGYMWACGIFTLPIITYMSVPSANFIYTGVRKTAALGPVSYEHAKWFWLETNAENEIVFLPNPPFTATKNTGTIFKTGLKIDDFSMTGIFGTPAGNSPTNLGLASGHDPNFVFTSANGISGSDSVPICPNTVMPEKVKTTQSNQTFTWNIPHAEVNDDGLSPNSFMGMYIRSTRHAYPQNFPYIPTAGTGLWSASFTASGYMHY